MAKKQPNRGRKPDPSSKRSQGLDRHADPRFTFHLEEELLRALDIYCESFPHSVGRAQVVRDCLREFLKSKGFFPVKEEEKDE